MALSLEGGDIRLLEAPGARRGPGVEAGVGHDGVGEGDVDLTVFRRCFMHLIEGVLGHTHLPHVLGCVGLIEHELDTEDKRNETFRIRTRRLKTPVFKPLTFNAKIFLVIDEISYFIPLEELRLLTIPLPHADPDEAGRQEDLVSGVILGEETLLAIPLQLLCSNDVIDLQNRFVKIEESLR